MSCNNFITYLWWFLHWNSYTSRLTSSSLTHGLLSQPSHNSMAIFCLSILSQFNLSHVVDFPYTVCSLAILGCCNRLLFCILNLLITHVFGAMPISQIITLGFSFAMAMVKILVTKFLFLD